jgi:hypothetical protein
MAIFALVLVLTSPFGAVTQYVVAEFPSLQSCEAVGQSHAKSQRPLYPDSQLQWYCMEKL